MGDRLCLNSCVRNKLSVSSARHKFRPWTKYFAAQPSFANDFNHTNPEPLTELLVALEFDSGFLFCVAVLSGNSQISSEGLLF